MIARALRSLALPQREPEDSVGC
ncbi:MAG: hypothetical protein RLZ99_773, partial [Actinomycetota bacterium]